MRRVVKRFLFYTTGSRGNVEPCRKPIADRAAGDAARAFGLVAAHAVQHLSRQVDMSKMRAVSWIGGPGFQRDETGSTLSGVFAWNSSRS